MKKKFLANREMSLRSLVYILLKTRLAMLSFQCIPLLVLNSNNVEQIPSSLLLGFIVQ